MKTLAWLAGGLLRLVTLLGAYMRDWQGADARARILREMDQDPTLRQWVIDQWNDYKRTFCGGCPAGPGEKAGRCPVCIVNLNAVLRERGMVSLAAAEQKTPVERPPILGESLDQQAAAAKLKEQP